MDKPMPEWLVKEHADAAVWYARMLSGNASDFASGVTWLWSRLPYCDLLAFVKRVAENELPRITFVDIGQARELVRRAEEGECPTSP